MRALVVIIAGLCLAVNSFAAPSFDWGTSGGQWLQDSSGVALTGDQNNPITGFIQMLYLGADKTYNGFIASGSGVLGDDVVVATSWVGQNVFFNTDGSFTPATEIYDTSSTNSLFLVRLFDTVSPNYAAGEVPTSGNYQYSSIFMGSTTTGPTQDADEFYLTSALQTTIAIPEPATLALAFTAIGFFVIKRLRRKKDD